MASLKTVPVPEPRNLDAFIKDRSAAIALGKAFFWDMAVGSDGQACASCHFHAGADSRSKSQLNPGFRAIPPDVTFSKFGTNGGGPNYQLQTTDYPFHKLADPNDRNSGVLFDTNDVTSSAGVFNARFTATQPPRLLDDNDAGTVAKPDPVFNVGGFDVRGVEPRNTPTMINAVFNHRNFWDGRARFEFNGRTPIGKLDPDAKVLHVPFLGAAPEEISLIDGSHPNFELENSSLASQAVGPPLSNLEMSFDGRNFSNLGRKIVPLQPLARQMVALDDSVLGSPMTTGRGLNTTYRDMIAAAFQNEWWDSDWTVLVNPDGSLAMSPPGTVSQSDLNDTSALAHHFLLIEYNFPLIWGLAVQMYEATLVANDSRVDQFLDGNSSALTAQEQAGKAIFEGKGKCINCHGGAETTNASVSNVVNAQELLERMVMGDGGIAVYDNGFYDVGVRSCAGLQADGVQGPCDDLGLGATIGPQNLPLSNSRFFQRPENIAQAPPIATRPDESPLLADPQPLQIDERVNVDGTLKTPGLRNIELTAPYFHNGGALTLRQVVDFYNRAGDFHNQNLDPDIQSLNLTTTEKSALVAFLKAFTDERVRYERAPFDHPELFVSNGAPLDNNTVANDGSGRAVQSTKHIPAVGRGGRQVADSNFLDPPPILAVQPGNITFTVKLLNLGTLPGQALQITNQGGGTLSWSATRSTPWLSLSLASGAAPSSPVVSVNPVGLVVGIFTDTITITAPDCSPVTVPVTLKITLF
jgi:cytochrome c peroxidase